MENFSELHVLYELLLWFGYLRIWRDHRSAIVGWMPRIHTLHANDTTEWTYTYDLFGKNCEYSMVITDGAFFHKVSNYYVTYKRSTVLSEVWLLCVLK